MRGATILKASDDKTRSLNKNTLMAFSGEAGDTGIAGHQIMAKGNLTDSTITQSNLPSSSKPTFSFIRCATIQN